MSDLETVKRWDAFLAKIRERVLETLAQAEEGCAMLLDLNSLDPQPMTIAWMAIENQLHELRAKIDATWFEKVEPGLTPGESVDRELAKSRALEHDIERLKDETELKIFAGAAAKIYEQARVNLAKDHSCTQCGAAVPLKQAFFRSRHETCPFCSSVNTFVPGSTVAAVEGFCVDQLAKQKTWALLQKSRQTERAIRDDAPASVTVAEKALREYLTAYLRARIEIVPEYAANFDKDLAGKMAFFRSQYPG